MREHPLRVVHLVGVGEKFLEAARHASDVVDEPFEQVDIFAGRSLAAELDLVLDIQVLYHLHPELCREFVHLVLHHIAPGTPYLAMSSS